jgi:hypothetical protein
MIYNYPTNGNYYLVKILIMAALAKKKCAIFKSSKILNFICQKMSIYATCVAQKHHGTVSILQTRRASDAFTLA